MKAPVIKLQFGIEGWLDSLCQTCLWQPKWQNSRRASVRTFLTLGRTLFKVEGSGGGGGLPPPLFFGVFFLVDKTSAPDVFCSCSFLPRAHFETSLVMVSYSGYEIWCSRWSSHFRIKMHVFQLLWTIKAQVVDEMMESVYLCVILRFKHKKWPFIGVLTWFLILGKIQNGGPNGDHCWCRHRSPAAPPPTKYTSSCWEDQRLSTKGKIVSKYYQKLQGEVPSNSPHSPCATVGVYCMNCVYVRGLRRRLLFTVEGHEDVSVWKIF